ncbi:hypothetical protein ABZV34_33805 [Streptomyces sp. NPDC005195]|uniref:hypothetical protein n=1 Tax=Streptomyces sp. NPDC005195 TaxID=3154561 RepID=UPI0033A764DE
MHGRVVRVEDGFLADQQVWEIREMSQSKPKKKTAAAKKAPAKKAARMTAASTAKTPARRQRGA